MNNLARGGVVLILISLFVVFMYAQTRSENSPAIANDSHKDLKDAVETEVAEIIASPTPDTKINKIAKKEDKANKENTNNDTNTDTNTNKLITKTVLTGKTNTAAEVSTGSRSLGSFSATAYCLQGRTAMGTGVRRGIIAADPRVLKLGTRVTLSGGGYSGTYIVADTGGAIRGRRLDIWVPNCGEARRFGRRSVTVSVN